MRPKARSRMTALQLAHEMKKKRSERRREVERLRTRIEDLRNSQTSVGPVVQYNENGIPIIQEEPHPASQVNKGRHISGKFASLLQRFEQAVDTGDQKTLAQPIEPCEADSKFDPYNGPSGKSETMRLPPPHLRVLGRAAAKKKSSTKPRVEPKEKAKKAQAPPEPVSPPNVPRLVPRRGTTQARPSPPSPTSAMGLDKETAPHQPTMARHGSPTNLSEYQAALRRYHTRLGYYQATIQHAKQGDVQAQAFLAGFGHVIKQSLEQHYDTLGIWDAQHKETYHVDQTVDHNKTTVPRASSRLSTAEEDQLWDGLSQAYFLRHGPSHDETLDFTDMTIRGRWGSPERNRDEEVNPTSPLGTVSVPFPVSSYDDSSFFYENSVPENDPPPMVSTTPSGVDDDEDEKIMQEFIERYKELKRKHRRGADQGKVKNLLESIRKALGDDETATTATRTSSSSLMESIESFMEDLSQQARDVASCTCDGPEEPATAVTTKFVAQQKKKMASQRH